MAEVVQIVFNLDNSCATLLSIITLIHLYFKTQLASAYWGDFYLRNKKIR